MLPLERPLVDLRGLRLLVVGGGSGIGLAAVELARAAGADVCATYHGAVEKAALAAADLRWTAHCDITDPAAVDAAVEAAADALGGLDAAVVTSGIFEHRGLAETAAQDWARILAINLSGPYHVARAVAPRFERQRGGSLVLFSSQIGIIGHRRATAYAASKGGVNALARSLALEFAPFGARVNAVAPGPIETPMTAAARADPQRRDALLASVPLGRFGRADEVARLALYLASHDAAYITGQIVIIDGGVTAA